MNLLSLSLTSLQAPLKFNSWPFKPFLSLFTQLILLHLLRKMIITTADYECHSTLTNLEKQVRQRAHYLASCDGL